MMIHFIAMCALRKQTLFIWPKSTHIDVYGRKQIMRLAFYQQQQQQLLLRATAALAWAASSVCGRPAANAIVPKWISAASRFWFACAVRARAPRWWLWCPRPRRSSPARPGGPRSRPPTAKCGRGPGASSTSTIMDTWLCAPMPSPLMWADVF